MNARPATPKLSRGDEVFVSSRSRLATHSETFVVVTAGPRWIHLVRSKYFGTSLERGNVRKFLLADQGEGEPAKRVGSPPRFATAEQNAYDIETDNAQRFLTRVAMLEIPTGSPFRDRGRMIMLAAAVREILPTAVVEAYDNA